MTTIIGEFIRALGVAALLAAALSVPAGAAQTAPKSAAQRNCEAVGRVWDANQGCATKVHRQ